MREGNMIQRPRRLRGSSILRKMTRETRADKSALVYPLFIQEGQGIKEEISAMPGQYRYSVDQMPYKLEQLKLAGVDSILLFGIPNEKDAVGSGAYAQSGIVQRALEEAKKQFGTDLYLITDVCMCEYTDHGHCGILCKNPQQEIHTSFAAPDVDNDVTLTVLAQIALSHVQAGADMVAPSDMMDGRVLAVRKRLDEHGFTGIPIMSYAAKYASAFYGPFREAAGSAPMFGDRKTYQMDSHNRKEALKEVLLDVEEGADIIMVKPALAYQDIIREVADLVNAPVATYSVSGEYSMVKAASKAGYIDEERIIAEMAIGAFRAGASIYLTYFAEELARLMDRGDIG